MNQNLKSNSQEHGLSFIDNLKVPACIVTAQLTILRSNKPFSIIFGLSRSNSKDLPLTHFFRIDEILDDLLSKIANPHAEENSFRFFALAKGLNTAGKSGETKLLLQRLEMPENYFLLTILESRSKSTELRPDVSEKHLFRLLLNELPDAIYFKDLKGRFFLTNRLHVRKLGFQSVEDFIGKTDFDLFTEEHASEAFDDEQEVIKSGITISKEEKETHLDGTVTYASTSKMPLKNERGKVIGTFGISKDITAIKNAEIELRKAREELQTANDAKDKFFSILAHDLKNPFNSLIGLSDLLIEEYHDFSDVEIVDMLKRLRQTSETTFALLENLLDWSQMQNNSITFSPEPVELHELISDIVDLNQSHAFSKNISLFQQTPKEISIVADKNMLRTIIRNLVSNAIKFTPKGGKVSVKSHEVAENVVITVEDTGIGMDENTLKNLFKISEKVKSYGTDEETGTGLGLIIVHEFVEKHQGTVAVQSLHGKGTKFTVSFPGKKF